MQHSCINIYFKFTKTIYKVEQPLKSMEINKIIYQYKFNK